MNIFLINKTYMMKTRLATAFSLVSCFYFSQVGIGNNVTTFDDSEVLKIVSSNRGVLFPNISIPDLSQAAPVANPANSLIVYNTNTASGKGFYYWKDNKWNPLLDTNNVYKYLGIVNSTSVVSTDSGVNDATGIGGVAYAIGELPSANQWQEIPGLSKTVSIYSPVNSVSVTAGGIAQINSSASDDTYMSYSIALFIDGTLQGVRNFNISGNENCLLNNFNVAFNFSNLTIGNHTFKIYETLRVNNVSSQSITFGAKHSSCSNINSTMDKSLMNIQIVEK